MRKNKMIIILIIVSIVILASAVGIYFTAKSKTTNDEIGKLNNYYEKLKNTSSYSFTSWLDDQNNVKYSKNNNESYNETTYQGKNTKYIVKNGNTYLVKDSEKVYYTYENNETDLYAIEMQIADIKENEASSGKEKIEGKQYKYEEFKGISNFYIGNINANDENTKTRFYFDGDNLAYIKTIVDENTEQLLKIEFSETVDNKIFNIPTNYKEM